MTTIYLIRHGRVSNPRRVIYGFLPGFHLSPQGKVQARRAGRALVGEHVTALYTSPVERARETAEEIVAALAKRLPIHERSELREAEVVRLWQGTPYYRVPFRFPRQWAGWIHHPERVRYAENSVAIASRVNAMITEIVRNHPGETVVAVSHAAPIKAWVYWKRGLSWQRYHRTRVRNAGGYRIEIDGRGVHSAQSFRP